MAIAHIPVPEERLPEVYEALARLFARESPRASSTADPSDDLVRTAYLESETPMRSILDYLADRSGQWVPVEDLRAGASMSEGSFRGTMGAFGHRRSSRYQQGGQWPFETRWTGIRTEYRMTADTAL